MLNEDQVIQNLLNKQVDGVIYMSNLMSESAQEIFKRTNTPVVLAGTADANQNFPSVTIDYKAAEKEALGYGVKVDLNIPMLRPVKVSHSMLAVPPP